MTRNNKPKTKGQTSKGRTFGTENKSYMRGMQDLRFGNAAGPHKPKTAYKRSDKSWKAGY